MVKTQSNLDLARAAKKAAGNTFCGIVKSLYSYSETEEGKFLRSFLPKNEKAFLERGAEVCKWGKVGEPKKSGKREYIIKISADIVLRFINMETKQKAEGASVIKKTTTPKKGTKKNAKKGGKK